MTNMQQVKSKMQHAKRHSFFIRCILQFGFAALVLIACGSSGGRPGYTAQQQTADGLTITLEQPRDVQILKDYEMFVTLADAQGQPVDGASVYADLAMATMPMGSNQPLADPLGNGQYSIKGVFTMEGNWHVTVHATIAKKEHVASFDQQVTLPK